ncbi:MAG TPA: response regulator, partial [Candidatus Aminicenantes bacterium]|nr:response regulator [Candidatus Aminicenantes bacterium]
ADILLPQGDGLTLTQRIKSHPQLKNIPIILISGVYKGSAFQADVKNLAIEAYLPKPIDHQKLKKEVKRILIKNTSDEKANHSG